MRDNRSVMTALFESAMAAGPASGALWARLTEDTRMLREHLEYLRARGYQLPGDPALIAAAMGAMVSMLAFTLLPAEPAAAPHRQPEPAQPETAPSGPPDSAPGYSSSDVVDSLTRLLLYGLAGPADR